MRFLMSSAWAGVGVVVDGGGDAMDRGAPAFTACQEEKAPDRQHLDEALHGSARRPSEARPKPGPKVTAGSARARARNKVRCRP